MSEQIQRERQQHIRVGDVLLNGYASQSNPIRVSLVYKLDKDYVYCWIVEGGQLVNIRYERRIIEYGDPERDYELVFKILGNSGLIGFVRAAIGAPGLKPNFKND